MASLTSHITGCDSDEPITFDNVLVNVENGYDNRHGVFRAPRYFLLRYYVIQFVKNVYVKRNIFSKYNITCRWDSKFIYCNNTSVCKKCSLPDYLCSVVKKTLQGCLCITYWFIDISVTYVLKSRISFILTAK